MKIYKIQICKVCGRKRWLATNKEAKSGFYSVGDPEMVVCDTCKQEKANAS